MRHSVLHFFENLGEPANFLNELMQLNLSAPAAPARASRSIPRWGSSASSTPRSTSVCREPTTDFGETLGVYGVGDGWYLVIPVIGPSSVRDLFGDLVNGFLHPQSYFLTFAPQAILATSSGFSRYEASRDELSALRDSSVDFYSAMRSAYLMQRAADVRDARASSPVLRPAARRRRRGARALAPQSGVEPSTVPASAAAIFCRTAARSASKPSRRISAAYSERRSASSLTVPLRYTSMMRQTPAAGRMR